MNYNNENLLFSYFYTEWLEQGIQEFRKGTEDSRICSESLCEDFLKVLYGKLNGIALRTLIAEMHICKEEKLLSGKDSREEYQYYNKVILADSGYRDGLLRKYPVLKSCLDEACTNTVRHMVDMVKRFTRDVEKIENVILHKKISKITGLQSNLSDAHNKGKSVIRLQIDDNDYLIYKPHSVENEVIFHELTKDIGSAISLDFYTPAIISCDGYGWEAYVEQKSCSSEAEVRRFYKRIGVCLFLSYLLKTADLHQENLIASGEYPVFVDMEALFTVRPDDAETGIKDKIGRFLKESVLSTGILPFYHWNAQDQGIDVSALSEAKEQTLPARIPVPVELYTSDMHIDYVYGKIKPAKNAVFLCEGKVSPEKYVQEVIWGFQRSYEEVMEHKDFAMKWVSRLHYQYSRYLVADTQKYSMILSASYHPDLMADCADRENLFRRLWMSQKEQSEKAKRLHQFEMEDLLQGDVPIFHVRFDKRSLFFHASEVIENYIQEAPRDCFIKTIRNLSSKDLMYQTMLMETSMSIPNRQMDAMSPMLSATKSSEQIDKKFLLECAIYRLSEFALHAEDRKEIGWLAPRVVGREDSRFQIQHMGMYLYDGLAGMLLLFSLIVYKLHNNWHRQMYEKLKNQLFSYTEKVKADIRLAESENTGILNGESSIIAVYIMLYKITEDVTYLEMAGQHAAIVKELLLSDKNHDLLDGKAGAILAFSELYLLTDDKDYLDWATKAEAALTSASLETEDEMTWPYPGMAHPLLGMAHGNAGISLAYGKLYEVTGQECYLERLEKVIRYEHRRYSEELEDWYDYRKNTYSEEISSKPAAWCHGAGGILSARLELQHLNLPESLRTMIETDIKRAVHKLRKSSLRATLGLCHGTGGNLLIMKKYLAHHVDRELEELCKRGYAYVCECLEYNKIELIREKYGMGLMTGYGGIVFSAIVNEVLETKSDNLRQKQ